MLVHGRDTLQQWCAWVLMGRLGLAGRTGTFVSAWEILAGVKTKDVALRETTAEVDEQKEILLELSAGELAFT